MQSAGAKPKINLKKIKLKPSKKFQYPKKNKYLNISFVAKKNWGEFLKKKKNFLRTCPGI